jgi:cation diffusion facilitator family transporter
MGVALQLGDLFPGNSDGSGSSNSHQNDSHDGKKSKKNVNVRAALIHVFGDFIQNVGVLIAAIVIYLKPKWQFIDPICTFIFSIIVLFTTINVMKDILNVLMEGISYQLFLLN